jgi:hypothetical protein
MINSFGYPDLSLSIGVRAFGLGSRLQTLASEKVMTPLWVCIDNSEKGGTRSSIGVVRHCIRALSFSKNVWTEDCPTQRGLGGNPTVNAKIALSKLITSASIDKGFPVTTVSKQGRTAFPARRTRRRAVCDRKQRIFFETDCASLKQWNAVSRTMGLEHQCPFTPNPVDP